jgi:cytochrome c553
MAAALVAAAVFSGPAAAQDAARGRELAVSAHCANCHGVDGRSQMEGIPSLAGQQPGYITLQMILFRETIRQVPAMQAFAANMPDKDIEDLAAYYASLPPGHPDDRRPRDAALFAAGEALIGPRNCRSCHLPSLAGREQIPRINFQREEFLTHTMIEYRDGKRVGADTVMNSAVFGMTDQQLAAVAHYLAHVE